MYSQSMLSAEKIDIDMLAIQTVNIVDCIVLQPWRI